MKSSSKVIMGASLVMVVSLAIVLGLVLVLLVELYCSLLLRRRQLRNNTANTTTNTISSQPTQAQEQSNSPLTSFYSQGVLDAPRSFLFPKVSSKENKEEMKKQSLQLHTQEANTSPHCIRIISPSSPSTSFITSPQPIRETSIHVDINSNSGCNDKARSGGGIDGEHFVYISNPIYDNDVTRVSRADTPFETPDSSPSRLQTEGSSGEDETAQPSPSTSSPHSAPTTPPLTPMKKLPAEACSVSLSLRDARSSATSASDSVSNNGLSSSTSASPSTSPSW